MRKLPLVIAATTLCGATAVAAQEALEELMTITVTARKVEENINDVPLAISAFSADEMLRRNIQGLTDIARYTPSLSFEDYSGGTNPAPVIRGLTQNTLTDRNQNVATFVDGIHVQQQPNIDYSLLDIERVEVLRGPQNSQYGRSAFAGAINYVSQAPVLGEWQGYVTAVAGTDERRDIKASLSLSLWSDKLAIRVYGVKSEFDGTWTNHFSGGDRGVSTVSQFGHHFEGTDGKLGGWDNQAGRVALRFEPIEELTIDASYYRSETKNEFGATQQIRPLGVSLWGQPYETNCSPSALNGRNQLYCGELQSDASQMRVDLRNTGAYTHSDLLSASAQWRPTDKLSVTYQYGRNLLDYDAIQQTSVPPNAEREVCDPVFLFNPCAPGQAGIVLLGTGPLDQEAESHELRLDGTLLDDALTWRLGYYQSEVDDDQLLNSTERRRSLIQDPSGQIVVLNAPLPRSLFHDETESFFGSAGYGFNDQWTLEVEGRYTEEKRAQPTGTVAPRTFTEFTPRVNLRFEPSPLSMYYLSYAEGSKAGGFNTRTADPGYETYEPETNETYELGGKLTLLGQRLQVNYALFFVDWKGLQLPTPDNIPSNPPAVDPNFIANVSGAESKGVELEVVYAPTDHWLFNLAGSYAEATFNDDVIDFANAGRCTSPQPVCPPLVIVQRPNGLPPVAGVDVGGNELPRTPKGKFSLGAEYRSQLGEWDYSVRGDLSYQDKQWVEILNLAYLPDRTLLDLNATFVSPSDSWRLTLWGKNVTDETVVTSAFFIGFVNSYAPTLAPGATWGLTATYNFRADR